MAEVAPSLWPYSERDSTQAVQALEILQSPAEIHLSDEERHEVHEYATHLFNGPPDVSGNTRNMREVDRVSTASNTELFYLDYLLSPGGAEDAAILGVVPDADALSVNKQLYGLTIADGAPDKDTRRRIANTSRDWYIATVAERLASPAEGDSAIDDSRTLHVNFEPEKLLEKLAYLQDFRSFYRTESKILQTEASSNLHEAKTVLLGVHREKINNMTASLYPSVLHLAEQLLQTPPSERTIALREQLFAIAPLIRRIYHEDEAGRTDEVQDFVRRLDLVRNGAQDVGAGNYSPISRVLQEVAHTIQTETAPEIAAVISPDLLAKLDGTIWHAAEFSSFLETMLDSWNLLSASKSDWQTVLDRSGTADDDRWQVIITPKTQSLAVNGKKKVMMVPQRYERSLTQLTPGGVLPISAHELTHVLQCEEDFKQAKQLPLAEAKGRRLTTREFAGIYEEQRMQQLFGRQRPTSTAYLRALEAKLAGANQLQVARTFMMSNGRQPSESSRKLAADRMLRLYRNGGYNSGPLDYIEQHLLATSMRDMPDDQIRAMGIAGGSFSVVDLAALHRVDLLDMPHTTEHKPAEEVLKKYLELYEPQTSVSQTSQT